MPTDALWDTGKWDDSVWDNIAAWTGIIRSTLSMLERDMEIEEAESSVVIYDPSDFDENDIESTEIPSLVRSKLELLERKMKMELTAE